jgi:hypothetical protein
MTISPAPDLRRNALAVIPLDLLAAYLPMAGPGIQIGSRMTQGKSAARKGEA